MIELSISMKQEADVVTSAGPKVRLTWLKKLYHKYIASGLYLWAIKAYLLHFIGNTIFNDKSSMYIHISFLPLVP